MNFKKKKTPNRRKSYHGEPALWPRNGRYYVLWTENGKTKTKSLKTADFLEAEERLREFREQLKFKDHSSLEPPTLHQAIDQWLRLKKTQVASKTMADYRYYAKKMKAFFANSIVVTSITGQEVEAYQLHLLKKGLQPYSVKKHLVALCAVFKRLVKHRIISFNPVESVDMQAEPGRRNAWPEDLYKKYLSTLMEEKNDSKDYRNKQIFQDLHDRAKVIWWSGLRTIEIDRLLWEDIDFSNPDEPQWTIRSPKKKGGTSTLPISPVLIPILKNRIDNGREGPFSGRYSAMKRGWAKFKSKFPEFADYDHHCLRHSFVTRTVSAHGREMASSLARHSSIEMNQHYDHRGISEMRSALKDDAA
jgi:integrase